MENKMNYYYYYHNNHYNNGSSSSSRPPPPHLHAHSQPLLRTCKQDENPELMGGQVQVVYYLSRNGQLEHPHFMELTLTSPYLRLKDVLERLTALRGKDMPSLYSWSCKRSYKHGYVWNDLTQNDIVYPTQGLDEYVLKGSLLPENKTSAEQVVEEAVEEDETSNSNSNSNSSYGYSYALSNVNTPLPSRCSVGISTDDMHEDEDYSPPTLSTSSSNCSEKMVEPSRNSVLLQLVACGGSNRCGMRSKQIVGKEDRKVVVVVSRSDKPLKSNVKVDEVVEEEDDKAMIKCMSENPRFGGFQTENKEYFSGSIVEAVAAEDRVAEGANGFKRSNSFSEERIKESDPEEARRTQVRVEVKAERQMLMTGKCLPGRKKKQTDHSHKC